MSSLKSEARFVHPGFRLTQG